MLSEVWRHLLGAMPTTVTPVQSTSLVLKDGSAVGDPNKRDLTMSAKTRRDPTANRIVPPAPGSDGDPRIYGAVIEVFNAAAGIETARLPLAASGWKLLGTEARPKGWTFKSASTADPIRTVTVKSDAISVRGGKALFCYSLNEPQQGTMAVRLTFGDGAEWCTAAPAKTSGNPPVAGKNDTVDRFTGAPKTLAGGVVRRWRRVPHSRVVEFVKKSTSGLGPQTSGSGILGFFLKPEARCLRPRRKVHKLVGSTSGGVTTARAR